MSHTGKAGEKAFEAPAKFDRTEFKWGAQTGANLSMFAPASFGDNQLGGPAIAPLKWDVPANFGSNAVKDESHKSHEQEEGDPDDDYEGDQGYEDDPEENGQSDYNLSGMEIGAANLPVVPGGPSSFSFGSSSAAAFSPSAFGAFPSLSSPSTSAFSPSTFTPAAFSASFPATAPFSPSAFGSPSSSTTTSASPSSFSTSTFNTSAFPATSAFSTSTFSATSVFNTSTFTPTSAFATTSTTPAFSFSPTASFGTFSAPPFSAAAFSSTSSTTSVSTTSSFASFGAPASTAPFTFHVPTSTTFSPGTAPFTMSTSAFSTGTSMFGSNDEPKSTSPATFATPAPFSFGSTSTFNPSAFAPAAFAVPSTPPIGGFLREPSFWSLEADAPVFNKNRGYVTNNTSVGMLEAKLQGWLKDAGVSSAFIEEHRAAFAKFRKEYVPPKTIKHIFVQDADRAFRSPEHKALFILIITYLEMKFQDYHQGLGLISAFLLLLTDPGTVIALVTKFNSDDKYAPGLWKAESVHSATDAYVYWELVAQHMPKLFANLRSVTPELFYQKYFCALCVHLLPFESLFIYFGLYAKHGYKAVISFALNLVSHLSKQILSQPEQHELLELLRLERKDINDATCLAIVTDSKDWQLGNHKWFVDKRVEVYKKYLEKRMKSSADAHKSVEQAPPVECGLCKAVAELYCEECGMDICEDCADANKGGHDQEEHTTFTQEEKPEVEVKEPSQATTAVVTDLATKTAAVSLTKPAPVVSPAPKTSPAPKAASPNVSKPLVPAPQIPSTHQAGPKVAVASPSAPTRKSDPKRALAALRVNIPSIASVLEALNKLAQDKLKTFNSSGINDELRTLLSDSNAKKVERASQRVRKRADPRAYSDEEFKSACELLSQFEEHKELQEILLGIRSFWQFTRTDMVAKFSHLETLIQPAPSLVSIRKVYRKARKLEKVRVSGAPAPTVEIAKAKFVRAQQSFKQPADWLNAIVADASQCRL